MQRFKKTAAGTWLPISNHRALYNKLIFYWFESRSIINRKRSIRYIWIDQYGYLVACMNLWCGFRIVPSNEHLLLFSMHYCMLALTQLRKIIREHTPSLSMNVCWSALYVSLYQTFFHKPRHKLILVVFQLTYRLE